MCSEHAKKVTSGKEYLLDNVEAYFSKAMQHFKDAQANFSKINHLKGESMALLHEAKLIKDADK